MGIIGEALMGVRFLLEVPAHLRRRLTYEEAERTLQARLVNRETDLVATLRRNVFDIPTSPYLPLLANAGCTIGDVERLVQTEGVEGGLAALFQAGVYLTADEFKGNAPVVRGSQTVHLSPGGFRNPFARGLRHGESSGRTGRATPRHIELEDSRGQAVNKLLAFAAQGDRGGWHEAKWEVPGAGVMGDLLDHAVMGNPFERWFTPVEISDRRLHSRYWWAARGVRWASQFAGPRLPDAEFASLEDPRPVVRWMADHLAQGHTPLISGYASMGVRVSLTAQRLGVDLTGGHAFVSGEPITAARHATIVASGLHPIPSYGSAETGTIGRACVNPSYPDDLHLMRDLHAAIQPGVFAPAELPGDALLLTSLRPTSRYVLLNVSLGDTAVLDESSCGCPMEVYGWTTHLHTIRSYTRVTTGGMALPDHLIAQTLDEVLPTRFGGAPTHYQLVETEAADGTPSLELVVHPTVGPVDEEAVAQAFFAAIGAGDGIERLTASLWEGAHFLRVVRRAPAPNAGGKTMHVLRARANTAPART